MTNKIKAARESAVKFVMNSQKSTGDFSLILSGDPGLFPRCFAIFALKLLNCEEELIKHRNIFAKKLRHDLRAYFNNRVVSSPLLDKPLMQALTFTLSALDTIDSLSEDPLGDIIEPLIPNDVEAELKRINALSGKAQSGNLAMFIAVLLIHARDYLGRDTSEKIDAWVKLHLKHMNHFGFWGQGSGMTHLYFQNGYHQYEIFDYLNIDNPKLNEAKSAVASLADRLGHFAPSPGGGGCFDFDAVFILTAGDQSNTRDRPLLERLLNTLLSEQNEDGGFSESKYIRPRSLGNLFYSFEQVMTSLFRPRLFNERLRYALTLQRPKHDLIHTHWSSEGRKWGESNLWDTWFRMLTIARIDVALNPTSHLNWGFLTYPGVGYYKCDKG